MHRNRRSNHPALIDSIANLDSSRADDHITLCAKTIVHSSDNIHR